MTTQLAAIRESLRDCLAWCERLRTAPPDNYEAYLAADPWYHGCGGWAALLTHPDALATSIRSRALAEAALQFLPESNRVCYGTDYQVVSSPDAAPETVAAFERFVQARRQILATHVTSAALSDEEVAQELLRPRALMLTNWQATVWDSASAFMSAGFFDLEDVPGWDTWLGLIEVSSRTSAYEPTRLCLVSWVPIWASDLVEKAIRVNPVDCMSWGVVSTDGITAKGWGGPWASDQT